MRRGTSRRSSPSRVSMSSAACRSYDCLAAAVLPILLTPRSRPAVVSAGHSMRSAASAARPAAASGCLGSPAGSCVWHVVGLQRSIREWAMRQGWGGRPVRVEQAQGILVAALGVLAGSYGYGRR
jgi:hypothetical protein